MFWGPDCLILSYLTSIAVTLISNIIIIMAASCTGRRGAPAEASSAPFIRGRKSFRRRSAPALRAGPRTPPGTPPAVRIETEKGSQLSFQILRYVKDRAVKGITGGSRASARCGGFCSVREGMLLSRASAVLVNFFCIPKLLLYS